MTAYRVQTVRPGGQTKVREFETARKAAQMGVFYYLVDNGYATKADATKAAATYQATGSVTVAGIQFQAV